MFFSLPSAADRMMVERNKEKKLYRAIFTSANKEAKVARHLYLSIHALIFINSLVIIPLNACILDKLFDMCRSARNATKHQERKTKHFILF